MQVFNAVFHVFSSNDFHERNQPINNMEQIYAYLCKSIAL